MITKNDGDKIRQLAEEGRQIARIRDEYFPKLDYWEVYSEVYDHGGKSARGTKHMITGRLRKLEVAKGKEKQLIIDEVDELVCDLYDTVKSNRIKLAKIREALKE